MATTSQEYTLERKTGANTSEEIKIPASSVVGLSPVATSGSYNDLKDKPSFDKYCTMQVVTFTGDGSKTTFEIEHTFGVDVSVQIFLTSQQFGGGTADELIIADTYTQNNKVTIVFGSAPTTAQVFKVVITGVMLNVGALNDTDWATINLISKTKSASKYFNIGDEKTIKLTDGQNVTLVILDFDHDDLADGSGKAGITFGMKNLLESRSKMNERNVNAGGWNGSYLRMNSLSDILTLLPSDLLASIKQVNKISTIGSKRAATITSLDNLFLFSLSEIYSQNALSKSTSGDIKNNSSVYMQEGTQYKYYNTLIGDSDPFVANDNLLKNLSNGVGENSNWWLRSPVYTSDMNFFTISNRYLSSNASATRGICFGFCV